MSLHVYLKKENIPEGLKYVMDVEKAFDMTRINGTNVDKRLMEIIEQGTYNDSTSFIDRFGFKLPITDLSTGCKAALCVANNTNTVIDLIECGFNARDAILKSCTEGHILFWDHDRTVSGGREDSIDVILNGHHFTNVEDFNLYVYESTLNGNLVLEV